MSDLPENEVQNLKSFIVGPVQQDGLQESNSLASGRVSGFLSNNFAIISLMKGGTVEGRGAGSLSVISFIVEK